MLRRFLISMTYLFWVFFWGCKSSILDVQKIEIHEFYSETLKLKISLETAASDSLILFFWSDDNSSQIQERSSNSSSAVFYLSNLKSKTAYSFFLQARKKKSKIFHYTTGSIDKYIDLRCKKLDLKDGSITESFKQGGVLLNKRMAPGAAIVYNNNGDVIWSHFFDNLGVRVSHFTENNTIISILGSDEDPTSYGRDVIEIDNKGDTLIHLEKGRGDFIYTPHHEVFKDASGNVVVLFLEKRIIDFSSIGGKSKDTITGDGIQVLTPQGKQIWKWSIFDVVNPLHEKGILKMKSDWLHANSLSYDHDGNYLISFFNSGEVWKINKTTGQVLWKFGKNGNIKCDKHIVFNQSHAFHSTGKGSYLCFDNQLETKQPVIHGYQIDESRRQASSIFEFRLSPDFFTDRMGSAYFVNDTTLLTCLSKKGKVVLTNKSGEILWGIQAEKLTPYRAEYISPEKIKTFLSAH